MSNLNIQEQNPNQAEINRVFHEKVPFEAFVMKVMGVRSGNEKQGSDWVIKYADVFRHLFESIVGTESESLIADKEYEKNPEYVFKSLRAFFEEKKKNLSHRPEKALELKVANESLEFIARALEELEKSKLIYH